MNNKIYNRVLKETNEIIETKKTIREIAKIMKVSKSTVHKDLHERLKNINLNKYDEVSKILDYHSSIKHINGGESTKKKYSLKRK